MTATKAQCAQNQTNNDLGSKPYSDGILFFE